MKFQRTDIIEFDVEAERRRIDSTYENKPIYTDEEREWLHKVLDAFVIGNMVEIGELFYLPKPKEEEWVSYLDETMWHLIMNCSKYKLIEE